MKPLAAHEQDKLRYLLNAFAAAPPAVRAQALRTLNAQAETPLRLVQGQKA